MIELDIDIGAWEGDRAWIEDALLKLNQHPAIQERTKSTLRLSLAFLPDEKMQDLNQTYRKKSTIPNVLSFAYSDKPSAEDGEILIAYPHVLEDAKKFERDPVTHAKYLLVHGVLHVLGFDHKEDSEAQVMETLEDDILQSHL